MTRHLNKVHLMMKDSLIIIRAQDRHIIRLIITQDRTIRSIPILTRIIRVRLTITRAHARLTILMAEDTDPSRRLQKWGQSSSPF